MKRRATIAVFACLTLAACGGSDDKSSGGSGATTASNATPPPAAAQLSRKELAAKADVICKTGETAAQGVKAPASFADAEDAAAYFEKIVPLHQTQTDGLAALEPDDEAKADWDAFMATQNENNDLLITILAKAKAKDASGAADLQKFTKNAQAFAAAATKIGSKECAGTA